MIEPIYSASPDRYDGKMKYRRCGKSGILLLIFCKRHCRL